MRKLIRVHDFETTGMEATDVVVEHGWCDVVDEGAGWKIGRHGSSLHYAYDIPPEVRAVHHITAADVATCAAFDPAKLWADAERDQVAIAASHNTEFDSKFWGETKVRVICTYKAALRVWPEAPAHNNGALRYWLEDQGLIRPDHALTLPPHRAGPDAYVTAHLLLALLQRVTAQQMEAWTRQPRLLPRCPIGRFRGKPWAEVETGFLEWMLRPDDMESDFVWNARLELERRRSLAA